MKRFNASELLEIKNKITIFCFLSFFMIFLSFLTSCNSEKSEWAKTKAINSIESYQKFLNNHPKSKFIQPAINAIDSINFSEIKTINTINAYNKFIEENPKSNYIKYAKIAIERIDYEKAISINTIESYNLYLSKYYKTATDTNLLDSAYIMMLESMKGQWSSDMTLYKKGEKSIQMNTTFIEMNSTSSIKFDYSVTEVEYNTIQLINNVIKIPQIENKYIKYELKYDDNSNVFLLKVKSDYLLNFENLILHYDTICGLEGSNNFVLGKENINIEVSIKIDSSNKHIWKISGKNAQNKLVEEYTLEFSKPKS